MAKSKTYWTLLSEELSALVVGGWNGSHDLTTAEIVPNRCDIPSLPKGISYNPNLVLTNDKKVLFCGGMDNKQCFELQEKEWVHHSNLTENRYFAAAVTMPKGTYLFGGEGSPDTWEWLPNGSSTWKPGGSIPGEMFDAGCIVEISSSEVLLLGGYYNGQRILKFNVETEKWTELEEKLQNVRYCHSCLSYKNSIVVSGGIDLYQYPGLWNSSEVFANKGNLALSHISYMNQARSSYSLTVAHINDQPMVLAIGGINDYDLNLMLDSIEVWDPNSKTWSLSSDLKLSEAKYSFAALSVPTHLVCP